MADEEEGVDVIEESPLLPSPVAVDCAGSIRTGKDTAAGGGRGEKGGRESTMRRCPTQWIKHDEESEAAAATGATRPPTRGFSPGWVPSARATLHRPRFSIPGFGKCS